MYPVLDRLSLQIKQGEYCVVIGSNGSGKSTLLKTITGECSLDEGEIFLEGQEVSKISIQERSRVISSVSQDLTSSSIAGMTVFENMVINSLKTVGSRFRFVDYHKKHMRHLLSLLNMGLEDFLDRKIGSLSGGQRQAIVTLMSLYPNPKILILDEHTSALDPKSKLSIMNFLDPIIVSENITSLIVTHNFEDAIKYGNRLIVMHKGRVVFDISGQDKKSLTIEKLIDMQQHLD